MHTVAASGHRDAFGLTPRQLIALAELESKRQARLLANQLVIQRIAQHGDKEAISKTLKELGAQ